MENIVFYRIRDKEGLILGSLEMLLGSAIAVILVMGAAMYIDDRISRKDIGGLKKKKNGSNQT